MDEEAGKDEKAEPYLRVRVKPEKEIRASLAVGFFDTATELAFIFSKRKYCDLFVDVLETHPEYYVLDVKGANKFPRSWLIETCEKEGCEEKILQGPMVINDWKVMDSVFCGECLIKELINENTSKERPWLSGTQ